MNPKRVALFAGISVLLFGVATISLAQSRSSPEAAGEIKNLIQQGDFASAQRLLSDALKQSPQDAILYNLDGVIKAQTKDYAGSEVSFQKAITLAPSYADAYLNLGRLYQEGFFRQEAARDKAITVYERLLKFDPDNVEANYQSAVLLMQKGRFSLSLQHLSKLPAAAQERSQALSVRCGDYVGLGQVPKAEAVVNQMLQNADLAEADVLSLLPLLAKYKSASIEIKLLEGLRERSLATANSLTSLGLVYKQQGRIADARKTLEAAAQSQPASVSLLLELARVADEQEDYTATLGYLAHARELEPQNATIHFFWGMTCVKLNLAEEAYQSLKKAVSLDPNNAYYNYALGAVASQREDASEAIPYFKKYCSLRPDDPRGRLALASAYFASHDDGSAEKILEAVAKYSETAAGAHYYLGRIANHRGNFAEAVKQLEMALKAHPDYADADAEMGLVLLKQKDYARARDDLEKAIKIDPDNYPANLNLLILYQRTQDPKADEQSKRFDQLTQKRAQRVKDFLRTIQVAP